jgi:tRNA dimethylallyltransferase
VARLVDRPPNAGSGARLVPQNAPLLVILLGPTASGKTALSLRLAGHFLGEIVSCDSVAVYRDFEIGSAKPTLAERRLIPHHLIDIASPEEGYSAGEYSRDARKAIAEISARGHLPIVTGGTGLYLRALLNGLFAGPARSDELRDRLRAIETQKGSGRLHRILGRIDPVAAAAIHPHDTPKLIRAIEVPLAAGKAITEAWATAVDSPESRPLTGYRILRIGLEPERQQLYARINARADAMFEQGLVEETRMLMEKYRPDLKLLDTLGYRQAAEHLRGEITLGAAIEQARQGHRNYAKRQFTWFRREPEVHWLAGFGDDEGVLDEAETLVRIASKHALKSLESLEER